MGFAYDWLNCVVRVQSVTWADVVGCPCDWWWVGGWICSPSPLIPLPSRERGTEVVLSFVFDHGQVMVFQFLSDSVQ